MTRTRFIVLAVLAAALALPGNARAQNGTVLKDVYKIDYFDNANCDAPDAKVRITNPGTTVVPAPPGVGGDVATDLCAMIYVFRPDQQLAECCGCKVTPNGLLKLSVNDDLTANPLTSDPFKSGVIKIVSTLPTRTQGPAGSSPDCNPADVRNLPVPALRAWATHNQETGGWPPFAITETSSQDATLSPEEYLVNLVLKCEFIVGKLLPPGLGSGKGLCKCPPEG
jgi:hypothetical protein